MEHTSVFSDIYGGQNSAFYIQRPIYGGTFPTFIGRQSIDHAPFADYYTSAVRYEPWVFLDLEITSIILGSEREGIASVVQQKFDWNILRIYSYVHRL
jgi:hypothetical protein